MSGRNTSQMTPVKRARTPVSTNRNGSVTEGACTLIGWDAFEGEFMDCAGSGAADLRQKTPIRLLFALSGKSALFELRVKMHRSAVGTRE